MRDACRVEAYSAEGGGKHFMTLPERIWQRGDLLLAAAGSLACVRTLYLRAAELGKLHQFLPCPLTRADYAAGQAAEHLAARLREAARRPGVGGVVLYASCAEVLTQCDLEQVAEQAGLPVRILLRGPLVARTRNAVADHVDDRDAGGGGIRRHAFGLVAEAGGDALLDVDRVVVSELVEFARGDARLDEGRQVVEKFGGEAAGDA